MVSMASVETSFAASMRPENKVPQMSPSFFWQAPEERSDDAAFTYYSGHLGTGELQLEDEDEMSFFEPLAPLYESILSKSMREAARTPTANIWLASQGSVAHTHYDMSHNAFVQLSGRKRFFLFPPSVYNRTHVYPKLHPSTRMSQLDFGDRADACSGSLCDYAFVADPDAGDLLYLPPFWFHRVSALTDSVSFNVWVSMEAVNRIRAFSRRLPLPQGANELRVYVSIVVEACQVGSASDYIAGEYATRYGLMFDAGAMVERVAGLRDWESCVPAAQRSLTDTEKEEELRSKASFDW